MLHPPSHYLLVRGASPESETGRAPHCNQVRWCAQNWTPSHSQSWRPPTVNNGIEKHWNFSISQSHTLPPMSTTAVCKKKPLSLWWNEGPKNLWAHLTSPKQFWSNCLWCQQTKQTRQNNQNEKKMSCRSFPKFWASMPSKLQNLQGNGQK